MPITDSWQAPPWLELPISTKQFSTGQSSLRGSWGVHEKLQLTAQVRTHIVCVRHSVIALFNGGNWCVVCSDSCHQGSRARSTVSSCIQYFGTEPHRTNRRLRFALEKFFINCFKRRCERHRGQAMTCPRIFWVPFGSLWVALGLARLTPPQDATACRDTAGTLCIGQGILCPFVVYVCPISFPTPIPPRHQFQTRAVFAVTWVADRDRFLERGVNT